MMTSNNTIIIMTMTTITTTTTPTTMATATDMAMTNHIIPAHLTLMAGWNAPANDNRP